MKLDKSELDRMVAEGLLISRPHPKGGLTIYNYAPEVQFKKKWCPITRMCRGLILEDDGTLHSRPFEKFFNIEEHHEPLPNEPFDVFEKLDGSLGISYWHDDTPQIATRGSFESPQSKAATIMLWTKYHLCLDNLYPEFTYLWEIIYPGNRIVVDYGDRHELVLLAVIHTETGQEVEHELLDSYGFPVVKKYDGISQIDTIREQFGEDNSEGFVVRFQSGLRVKLKLADYVRLHKLLTGVTPRRVWEILSSGQDLSEYLKNVPDEFYKWVTEIKDDLEEKFRAIKHECRVIWRHRPNVEKLDPAEARKITALHFTSSITKQYSPVLFKMLDGKPYEEQIWKMIRPKAEAAFRCDDGTVRPG